MLSAKNIQYELAGRGRGLAWGGIGAVHLLARQTGLVAALDEKLHLLKRHLPYQESDHVLNIAYNILCGGDCLEDLERLRQDEVYLEALGAQRIPDPTTAGDFCRRFTARDVELLQEIINEVRLRVWGQQPAAFLAEAIIDADGTLAETTGECKVGMDISYNGVWGYHPLLLSLANTGEPLYLINRSGNRPSSEGAALWYDRAIELCFRGGFLKVLLRGVRFIFGLNAMPNLIALAQDWPRKAWKLLIRPAKYDVRTQPRRRPERVKEQIIRERGFENIRLQSEEVAEVDYQPTKCRQSYRLVVVRKNLTVEKGEQALFDDVRYFFYITNDRTLTPGDIVRAANGRCNQENLIAPLKTGVQALALPVDNLVSNGAYMVMASLAWTLKAWFALLLPERGRWSEKYQAQKQTVLKMEFKKFRNALVQLPCQIVRTGRRILYRLLGWNPWLEVFLRGVAALALPLRC
jgi:hypothetical protein